MVEIVVPLDGDLAPVAEALCDGLRAGDVVHLRGPIGAGKTALVRACAERLGIAEPVTSPTFALAHRHVGPTPIAHLDLYRLPQQPERDTADVAGEIAADCVAFVEWPELGAPWLPAADAGAEIEVLADGARRFRVSPRR